MHLKGQKLVEPEDKTNQDQGKPLNLRFLHLSTHFREKFAISMLNPDVLSHQSLAVLISQWFPTKLTYLIFIVKRTLALKETPSSTKTST